MFAFGANLIDENCHSFCLTCQHNIPSKTPKKEQHQTSSLWVLWNHSHSMVYGEIGSQRVGPREAQVTKKTDELVLTAAPLLRWNLRTAAESAAHSMRGHIRQVGVGEIFATSQVVGMLWLKLSWYNFELHNHEIDNIWWYEILIDIV